MVNAAQRLKEILEPEDPENRQPSSVAAGISADPENPAGKLR